MAFTLDFGDASFAILGTQVFQRREAKKNAAELAKDNKNNRGWEKICAIMDRLDDTVFYLNSLELKILSQNKSFDKNTKINKIANNCIKMIKNRFL